MQIARLLLSLAIAAGISFMPMIMDSALAADDGPVSDSAVLDHELVCENGLCTLRVDLGEGAPVWLPTAGFAISVLEENLQVLPEGTGISVTDGLALNMPVGKLDLSNAKIELSMNEYGQVESFTGTASLPTPSLAMLGLPGGKKPLMTTIGYDEASKLSLGDAPLDPNRKYLYFDLASGIELQTALVGAVDESGETLWLSIPEGQKATVVIDPQERFVYIDGNVTMRYSGTLAFLTQMLDPAETLDLFNGELPIRHQATVHISGVLTDELANSKLEFAGRYAVDGGRLAEWVNLNGEPLALEGGVVISDAGILGTGVLRSTLLPENVWDGALQAQVFVPFSANYQDAFVAFNTSVKVPFANLAADGTARLDGAMGMVAQGSYSAPWIVHGTDATAATDLMAREDAQLGKPVFTVAPDESTQAEIAADASRWAKAWQATTEGVQAGIEQTRRPAGAAVSWVKDTAGAGYDSAAGGLEWSIDMASSQWCATTGICRDGGFTSDATAMK